MRFTRAIVVVFLGLALSGVPVTAQQPGKPEDPRELARPVSLCNIKRTDPRAALQELLSLVEGAGFTITVVHWNQGDLEASKPDGSASDRLVLWIERDLTEPTTRLNVYVAYGRYEQFWGALDLKRVVVDAKFEESRIGTLKQRIVKLALQGG